MLSSSLRYLLALACLTSASFANASLIVEFYVGEGTTTTPAEEEEQEANSAESVESFGSTFKVWFSLWARGVIG